MAQLQAAELPHAESAASEASSLAATRRRPRTRLSPNGRHGLILREDVRSCREVSVNSGGEPERDEYGLPPVDIEIPDDARDLDRDVQAYYRELRAERRRRRRHRMHLSLARDGIVLPLLACCLVLALITGTLLTVFTATSGQDLTPLPRSSNPAGNHQGGSRAPSRPNSPANKASPGSSGRPSKSSSPSRSPGPSKSGASSGAAAVIPGPDVREVSALPAGSLLVEGKYIPLQSLSGAMLVLLPPGCHCAKTVNWLVRVGASANALVFIVITPGMPTSSTLEALGYTDHLSKALRATVSVATDTGGVLNASYGTSGLTAVLVAVHSYPVYYVPQLKLGLSPVPLTRALES
jgi:hypothetical protein